MKLRFLVSVALIACFSAPALGQLLPGGMIKLTIKTVGDATCSFRPMYGDEIPLFGEVVRLVPNTQQSIIFPFVAQEMPFRGFEVYDGSEVYGPRIHTQPPLQERYEVNCNTDQAPMVD